MMQTQEDVARIVSYYLTMSDIECDHEQVVKDVVAVGNGRRFGNFPPSVIVSHKHLHSLATLEEAARQVAMAIELPPMIAGSTNLTRKDVESIHVKQIQETEGVVAKTLATHFRRSVRDTSQRIAGLELEPDPEHSVQQAEVILRATFDGEEELEDLLRTMGRALPPVFAAGALLEMELGSVAMKGTKTTAEEMAARLEIDADGLPFSIGELPEWLQDAAREKMRETFGEDYWQEIPQTTRGDIYDTLQDGIKEGWSMKQAAREINRLHGAAYSMVRAMRVARTEVSESLNAGHAAGISQLEAESGLAIGKEWISVLGSTTRASHAALDGVQTQSADGMFTLDGHRIPIPAHSSLPARHRIECKCLPRSAVVQGNIQAVTRGWYEGNLTEIVAGAGRRLAVTPNHPVLTRDRGMVAACKVAVGDYLVRYDRPIDAPFVGGTDGNHEENEPTTAAKVFELLFALPSFRSVKMRGCLEDDFHGDGRHMTSEVEIVMPDGELFSEAELMGKINLSHLDLSSEPMGPSILPGASASSPGSGSDRCADGGSSVSTLPASHPRHMQTFGPTSDMDARFAKDDLAGRFTAAEFLSELDETLPGAIAFDQVVRVHSIPYKGYVYDFQSPNGVTVADDYFVSNCTIISAFVMDALADEAAET